MKYLWIIDRKCLAAYCCCCCCIAVIVVVIQFSNSFFTTFYFQIYAFYVFKYIFFIWYSSVFSSFYFCMTTMRWRHKGKMNVLYTARTNELRFFLFHFGLCWNILILFKFVLRPSRHPVFVFPRPLVVEKNRHIWMKLILYTILRCLSASDDEKNDSLVGRAVGLSAIFCGKRGEETCNEWQTEYLKYFWIRRNFQRIQIK